MDKAKHFEKELPYIKNKEIREFTKKAIESLPDYFFSIPASSGGKYHPVFASGDGGLLRHTIACVRIAINLFELEMFDHFSDDEKDIILASLILHDGYKLGDGKTGHTVIEHPLLVALAIESDDNLKKIISETYLNKILGNLKVHMGQWVFDKSGKKVLEKPHGTMQNFVHLMDYLSSRKLIEINFDAELPKREE